MWQKSYDGNPTLYLIPTPIGNMDDMTYRAVKILNDVEVVFSEDTRVTGLLLKHFNISKKLISLQDHTEDMAKEKVFEYLKNGYSVGWVTDRGPPIISDPGYKTVKYVSDKGYNVVGLPGACAFVPALVVSGIASAPFTFYGFLDSKESKKKKELEKLKFNTSTLIFYEAPHRLVKTLSMMLEVFGDRDISISREISKKFESVYRGNISEVLKESDNLKGEFVIVVSGFSSVIDDNLSIYDSVNLHIASGIDKMDAIKMVAHDRKISKSEVYSLYHKEELKWN